MVFSIDFKHDNDKTETLKFQHSEFQKSEPNLTSMHTFDENVSENVNGTNVLQEQLFCSTNVQIDRGSIERVNMELPENVSGEFKTYMDYRMISDSGSMQYKLQQQAYTDENGFRKVDDAYCIALGSAYGTEIGTRYKIALDTGLEFTAILAECKDNKHTDSTNRYISENGNIIEWIVNTDKLNELALAMGDISYAGFKGKIIKIERIIE